MVKPAPIVEAAVALEAKPRASPIADAPLSSSKVHVDAPTNSVSELWCLGRCTSVSSTELSM